MSKSRIRQVNIERCLLTEVVPYETPMTFSNWGSYNLFRHLSKGRQTPSYIRSIFEDKRASTPYKFRIAKDADSFRTLFLVHPKHSKPVVQFYQKYSVFVLRCCKRSQFSIRAPHHVAKFYVTGEAEKPPIKQIEDISCEMAFASSFFAYSRYSHLHKFFDSDDFTELEKRYKYLAHLDITKFFASIYTHSISWAIRGKSQAKSELKKVRNDRQFDAEFDALLRKMNSDETNGIAIGPELSRIFSELILQRIDSVVLKRVNELGLKFGTDFWCSRYIDDYFFFYNDDASQILFNRVLSEELEKFRLFLGKDKTEISSRPFITEISVRKIALSKFLNDLFDGAAKVQAHTSQKYVNRFRSLIQTQGTDFHKVSAFFLAAITNRIDDLKTDDEQLFEKLYILLDLAFYSFRMDVRVATCYRIATIVLHAVKSRLNLAPHQWHKVTDKIVFEVRGAIESSIAQGRVVECVNLLIVACEIENVEVAPAELLRSAIGKFRIAHNDEYSASARLGYFEICALVYFLGKRPTDRGLMDEVIDEAVQILQSHDPMEYSESFYLLLDLTACPYISDADKDELIKAAFSHLPATYTNQQVNELRNWVSDRNWYFHWNENKDLEAHLKKKELLLAY